ncbi:hypothetical protein PF005_g16320 [Phytophthora fragariae]|uniref:Uncharacterized protein n=1 Tax=Phytophthora fragariae TaxID=53985 RepID=A0A6A3Y864_9STRA|nr:hypothetical protein PF003_g35255 [Phytophthora fragariae]KAE8932239.1 hypothetical protein PF009_g17719 [Phytophthora fragariae]KAE8998418.1 hypothetical protein PF011_g15062 [Phytophthora fragariae]KAE9087976.1 hypothetical protein PF007_g20160 [Phytophthora fragariae]KAE9097543.1 hypothetical protein PF010_g15922 [Phytophthora fragariae]
MMLLCTMLVQELAQEPMVQELAQELTQKLGAEDFELGES